MTTPNPDSATQWPSERVIAQLDADGPDALDALDHITGRMTDAEFDALVRWCDRHPDSEPYKSATATTRAKKPKSKARPKPPPQPVRIQPGTLGNKQQTQ